MQLRSVLLLCYGPSGMMIRASDLNIGLESQVAWNSLWIQFSFSLSLGIVITNWAYYLLKQISVSNTRWASTHCFPHSLAVPTNVSLNVQVNGTANNGEFKYYNFPFHSNGLTFRLDVFQGSIIIFASYTTDSPNTQRGYNWTTQTTIYDDLFFSPASANTVYVALQGSQSSNSFRIGVVAGDFTTTGIIRFR